MAEPLDATEFARWRAQGAAAVHAAELAAGGERYEWACFLSEQAAQLGLKGLLHALGLEAWGHDLVVLESRARDELGAAWPDGMADAAARLSRHYIPTRYPDAHASGAPGAHYRQADAEQAAADAAAVLRAIDAAWKTLGGETT